MSTYIYFTEAQKEQAKATDLVFFLQSRGEMLKRSGSEYEWRNGNAKVTIRGNKWFHHYDNEGGTAVDFVRRFFNVDFPEAMQILLGGNYGTLEISNQPTSKWPMKLFVLPEANSDMRRVYAYLLKQRFIEREVIHYFTHNKMLYEDKEFHNCVFVGHDENGIARHAHKRGTHSGSTYKGNVGGSNADYSFHYTGTSNTLFVFEAPIDMLSYISLYPKNWQQHSYVALCCVAEHAAIHQIKVNTNIDTVYLCLDHDMAGIEGCYRIAESIHKLGDYNVYRKEPIHKDWNEQLKEKNGIQPIPGTDHPNLECVRELCISLSEDRIEWSDEYEQLRKYPQQLNARFFDKLTKSLDILKNTNPNNISVVQERTLEITRSALAFSFLRHRQLGIKTNEQWYTGFMLNQYNPFHNNGSYNRRITDMENELNLIKQEYTSYNVYAKSEIENMINRVLGLGLDAVRLNAFVALNNQEQIEAPQMSM
ncbi:MAG TPA: hypothetical protein DEP23_13645 [Ruminococcaceae bacterium]|nr:hypothetical protein [Oscillospiraceae bacterium]